MARLRACLLEATYDWLAKYDLVPYVLIDAEHDNVQVPRDYVEDGRIVLNISPEAVQNFEVTDQFIRFDASFSGQAWEVFAPIAAVLALYSSETTQGIYAREGGIGMLVNEGEHEDDLDPSPEGSSTTLRSKLRIVK